MIEHWSQITLLEVQEIPNGFAVVVFDKNVLWTENSD